MGEDAVILLELAERLLAEQRGIMTPAERTRADRWAKRATGEDVVLLLIEGHRRWRRGRTSSSPTLEIVEALATPSEPPPPPTEPGDK